MSSSAQTWNAIVRGERRGPVALLARTLLRLASLPYGLAVRLRNALFNRGVKKSHLAAVPVISVGNLTLGGTGKTPCVEYLAELCRDRLNRRPVILSRGYGSEAGRNDEAMVLEENLPDVPHLQGADRVSLATTAIDELEAEAIILDDGFQHRRLKRDLDIVLLDATRPVANESMFPRGYLREPVSSLKRAHLLMLTRCGQNVGSQVEYLKKYNVPILTSEHRPVTWCNSVEMPLGQFDGRPVAAFCGLGNPQAFRSTLESLNHQPLQFRTFNDHHNYTRADVDDLRRWAESLPNDAAVLTTQKDWVKLRIDELAGRPLAALKIKLAVTAGEETLLQMLDDKIGKLETDE